MRRLNLAAGDSKLSNDLIGDSGKELVRCGLVIRGGSYVNYSWVSYRLLNRR